MQKSQEVEIRLGWLVLVLAQKWKIFVGQPFLGGVCGVRRGSVLHEAPTATAEVLDSPLAPLRWVPGAGTQRR